MPCETIGGTELRSASQSSWPYWSDRYRQTALCRSHSWSLSSRHYL